MAKGSKKSSRTLSVYSNLVNQRKSKKDAQLRRKAEYLATLPKHPVKRVMYRLHPKRFWAYWFSREGLVMAGKITATGIGLILLLFMGLFAYYRQEIAAIQPGELANRVQSTVTRYYDRNGVLLWEDRGTGDYKLVVKSEEIAEKMKQATIAIEDKDFYKHGGFSATGIIRATWNNFRGGDTQGASTLTQQLVKQVFFRDEAADRSFGGVPRKIKETILAIEVERSYNKDQILTMYLNESSYGGRRNGVQSAAQTYFAKDAKDLSLAEASLLAAIPQQPGRFNPYTIISENDADAKKDLLARQHTTLSYMIEQGYITKAEADEAKKVPILDTIKPESDQFKDIKAPHFVQMVKAQLESELGQATVGAGGLTVKTTLDYRAQQVVEKGITDLFNSNTPRYANFDNAAVTVVDVPTSQVLALLGSRDYNYPGYGYVNSADAFLQPGSSIKPFVYAALFKQRDGVNYGPGSVLSDEPLPQSIYATAEGTPVQNFDKKFRGAIPIRNSLPESRNVPAIKAMYIAGRELTLNTIHDMGDSSYCTNGVDKQVTLSASIGGCGLKQIEHANAYATLARQGVYKPYATIIEVKNSEGQVIKKWQDNGKQVIDPQIPYMITDMLSDDAARVASYGRGAIGLNTPGVKTFVKTGASNAGKLGKDLWMTGGSTKVALAMWVGNHDSSPLANVPSITIGSTFSKIMGPLHTQVYGPEGSWKATDWFTQPAGIQRLTVNGRTDIWPSWYSKTTSNPVVKITFDKVSKKKATECTPDTAKIEIEVQKFTDPITKKDMYFSPDGYDANADDDVHQCGDVPPNIGNITYSKSQKQITVQVDQTSHSIQTVSFSVNGQEIGSLPGTGSGLYVIDYNGGNSSFTVTVTATDSALDSSTLPKTLN
ncbi:penicillin-binding protein [Candidatus Saccharibacteria bacterium]|nr:penicillin-binding protein [Candidatus Saccharibacteria bacterium]